MILKKTLSLQAFDVYKKIGNKKCEFCGKPIVDHCCNLSRFGNIEYICQGIWKVLKVK